MKTLALSITGIIFVAIAIAYIMFQSRETLGSVAVSNEYNSVVYTSVQRGTSTVNSRKATTLGNILISSTSPSSTSGPVIAFYDTSSTTRSTTTMTAFAQMGAIGSAVIPAGEYTFDVMASSGLQIWVDPAFTGVYTITYR